VVHATTERPRGAEPPRANVTWIVAPFGPISVTVGVLMVALASGYND
jgi:hypothetical protein